MPLLNILQPVAIRRQALFMQLAGICIVSVYKFLLISSKIDLKTSIALYDSAL